MSPFARLAALAVFVCIIGGFGILWASEKGCLNLTFWLGGCGFKQRFGLPCPGCGWTHAAQAFVTGHMWDAFYTQPAAAVFCGVGLVAAIFALHCAVFGLDFGLLKRVFCSAGVKVMLIAGVIIIIAGWLVTLIRTMLEQ